MLTINDITQVGNFSLFTSECVCCANIVQFCSSPSREQTFFFFFFLSPTIDNSHFLCKITASKKKRGQLNVSVMPHPHLPADVCIQYSDSFHTVLFSQQKTKQQKNWCRDIIYLTTLAQSCIVYSPVADCSVCAAVSPSVPIVKRWTVYAEEALCFPYALHIWLSATRTQFG